MPKLFLTNILVFAVLVFHAHCLQLQQVGATLELGLAGSVVPQHVGSFRTRDWTSVPCAARWILTTRSLTTHWAVSLKPVPLLRPHSLMCSLTVIFHSSLFSHSLSLFSSSHWLCLPLSLSCPFSGTAFGWWVRSLLAWDLPGLAHRHHLLS